MNNNWRTIEIELNIRHDIYIYGQITRLVEIVTFEVRVLFIMKSTGIHIFYSYTYATNGRQNRTQIG